MNAEIKCLLIENGYLVQESKGQLLIRKRLMMGWGMFISYFIPGALIVLLVFIFGYMGHPALLLFLLASAAVLMVIPFFQYFTSSYKSLLINYNNGSLLFRSAISRAYRFFEIQELNLEVMSQPIAKNKVAQQYAITIRFSNGAKEELLSVTLGAEQSESAIFKLKDYFQVLLSQRPSC